MKLGIKAGLAVVWLLLLLPTAAVAAAPPNDDFDEAEVVAGPLPLAASGTNIEATTEAGEPTPKMALGTQGHTVWFEWEATTSGFVTVSTCDSDFETTLGVYRGSIVDSLTEVAGEFASLGPDCPNTSRAAVTFDAVAGLTYEIVVDGYESIFPTEPFGQGTIALEIAKTPKPPNDDFAEATVLNGEYLWNGVYAAGGSGFSWNATKEVGEPAHAGNPGGASVWFAWTAPFSARFHAGGCGRFEEMVFAAYAGTAVGALTPLASDDHSCSNLQFDATAGTTYHFAIDGKFDSAASRTLMGYVSINLYWDPHEAAPPFEEGRDAPQAAPPPHPETVIRKKLLKPRTRSITFTFGSSEAGSRFRCMLDRGSFGGCKSPKTYKHLRPGRHVFSVQAVNRRGGFDDSPASVRFKVPQHVALR